MLLLIAKILPLIIKPDRRTVIFGAMDGANYGDNSLYLYLWMLKNRPGLKPVWMTKNINIYQTLRKQDKPVVFVKNFASTKHLSRARAGVFTNSLYDLMAYPAMIPRRLQLIALRHGRSVKKVRFARERHKINKTEERKRKIESRHIRYAISTSDFISDIQEECLRIGREKHIVTGYPRNDVLFSPSEKEMKRWEDYIKGLKPGKVVLYAPSWRHGRKPTIFFPFEDFKKEELFEWLKMNNTLLLLRPHRRDFQKYRETRTFLEKLASESRLIRFASHDIFPDVNSILPFIDILVTDYSAIYHDFLLLNRPIVFIPYDYEEFEKQNGFLYNYFANLPGPAVYKCENLYRVIEDFCGGKDDFAKKRNLLKNKVHLYKDAGSCERVSKLVENILQGKGK